MLHRTNFVVLIFKENKPCHFIILYAPHRPPSTLGGGHIVFDQPEYAFVPRLKPTKAGPEATRGVQYVMKIHS